MAKLLITWRQSGIGNTQDKRRTLRALGLRRLHQVVEHEDTPTIRGMVEKVRHMVTLEEAP